MLKKDKMVAERLDVQSNNSNIISYIMILKHIGVYSDIIVAHGAVIRHMRNSA